MHTLTYRSSKTLLFWCQACLAFTVYGLVTSGPSSLGYNHIPDDMSSVWGDIAGGVLVGFIFIVLLVVAVIKVAQAPGSCAEVCVI